ncbi:MAG: outer membrane protein transport protein [Deltaproteobacteria bacterium]|nr:outer membrane protein transport protein [Deltaproteobacteria bacterium]
MRGAVVVVVVGGIVSSGAWANGAAETYGHDVRSQGKGNAVVADDSGPSAAFVNPAALARLKGTALHVGFSLAVPTVDVALEKPLSADDPLVPANPAPVAGITAGLAGPLDLVVDDRLYLGFTAYMPSVALVRGRAYDPARPSFYIYDASTEHYEVFGAVALRLTDWASIGVGTRFGAGQGGDTTLIIDPVRGRFTRQELDTSQFSVMSPIAGLLIGPIGVPEVKGRLAFVVRDRSSFDVTLPASLTISGVDVGLVLDIVTLSNFSPRTWTTGLTVEVLESVSFAVDLQYAQWSEAPSPFLKVSNDISGEGLDRLGLGDALDAPAAGQERVISPGFVDTLNIRVGVEGALLDGLLLLRGGYGYRPTPVPDQTSGTNIVDNTAHIVSVGAGLLVNLPMVADKPFQVNGSYQAQILQERVTEKASSRDEVGGWTSSGVVSNVGLDFRYSW